MCLLNLLILLLLLCCDFTVIVLLSLMILPRSISNDNGTAVIVTTAGTSYARDCRDVSLQFTRCTVVGLLIKHSVNLLMPI